MIQFVSFLIALAIIIVSHFLSKRFSQDSGEKEKLPPYMYAPHLPVDSRHVSQSVNLPKEPVLDERTYNLKMLEK